MTTAPSPTWQEQESVSAMNRSKSFDGRFPYCRFTTTCIITYTQPDMAEKVIDGRIKLENSGL
jgi:hypothetical protein